MSSKRSSRLSNSKSDLTPSQKSSNRKSGGGTKGIESPKSDGKKENQQEKSKSEPVAQVPETTTLENSSSPLAKQSSVTSKKNKSLAMPSTPPSAVRRSGRAPVPSSRYKDMEVETPGSRKRSLASTTGASEKEQGASRKRLKKQSKNSETESPITETSADSTDSAEEEKPNKPSEANSIKPTETNISEKKSSPKDLSSPQLKTVLLELSAEETYNDSQPKQQKDQVEEEAGADPVVVMETAGEEPSEEGNVPISVEEMIERSLQEGKIDKSDLEASSSAKQEDEGTPESGVLLEATIQEPSEKTVEEPAAPEVQEDQHIPTPSITIGGQQVTFEEREGETVAIVTIPSSLGDLQETQVVPVSAVDGERTDGQPLTDIVSMIPNSHGGHTVVTGKADDSSALAMPQKVTIEARQFSSLIKSKARTTNPATGHGRVIPRNEQQMTAMMFKSGVGSPSLTPSSSLGAVSSSQDVPSQKGSITYSLLPSLQQASASKSTKPSHGSIAARSNQKVIIVSQKPTEDAAGSNISTLESPSGQAQLVLPATASIGGSSTLIHVKKAQGSSLTASDLECVLKALSGKNTPEPESVQISGESLAAVNNEEVSALTADENSEHVEPKEEDSLPSTEVEGEKASAPVPLDEEDKLNKEGDHVIQGTADVSNDQNDVAEAVDLVEDGEKEDAPATTAAVTSPNKSTSEQDKAPTASLTEEGPNQNLPVESALYQALQALEPPSIVSEKSSHPDDADSAAPSELPVAEEAEGEDSKSEKWAVKGDTIKVVDNGIEYDVRIVCQEDVAEEIVDDSVEQDKTDKTEGITFKEEIMDESTVDDESGMQTSGTQTLYSMDKGSTIQRMATVVDKDGQKKQVYYVSVFPGKGVLNRVKSNQGARLTQASWVLSENGMFCCGKCPYKTDRKANFYKHRRLHIGTKPHICPVCQYKAGTSSNLKRHMGIHKDIREHKCDICGLCFRQKIHLERHVKYKHEVKSVHCPLCDYVCANEQPDLKMHMKRKHSNGKSGEMLKCPECQVEVGSKKDLKQHMKFHKDGPELKLFCKECSFVTDCQSRLRRHAAIHSKLKPFQCGVCTYRAAQKEHVLRHLRTQHKIEVKREVKKTWKSKKQADQEEVKTEKADFTSGDKIFACNHCTMRFAKLINLYKHLHTQHSDIMPPETSGNYYCVVCEFSTTTKKNLLVHMRRHNMTDQTPPTHVYSCVLCRYVNPKRRNLFQHMRKKHNIDISNQADDEAEAQVLEMGDVIKSVKDGVLTTETAANSVAGVVGTAAATTGEALTTMEIHENNNTTELGNLANIIKIEDLTRTGSTPPGEGNDSLATLVIDTHAGETAPMQIVNGTTASSLIQQQQQHSVDALEGLQALAEQAGLVDNIIEEQVSSLEQNQQSETVIIDQVATGEDDPSATTNVVEVVSGSSHLQELQEVGVVGERDVEEVGATGGVEYAGMELSEEQLSSLRHGDMVEMDGELYVVEMTHDPEQPNKQILSFVPVSATAVADQ